MDNRAYVRQLAYLKEKVRQKQRPLLWGVNKSSTERRKGLGLLFSDCKLAHKQMDLGEVFPGLSDVLHYSEH